MKRLATLVLFVVAACREEPEVRPQWTVTFRTDAPVPLVGDRLLVEVIGAGCDSCARLIDASTADAWPVSFGIAASSNALRVRARLYRARAVTRNGAPEPLATVDVVTALPAAPGPVAIPLAMTCFGLAATDAESCDPGSGTLAPIVVAATGTGDPLLSPGSWSDATSRPCASPAPSGMACVAGGLFFFGDADPGAEGREQLVRVSSFFADHDELSVGEARALLATTALTKTPQRRTNDKAATRACTYLGNDDRANDALPLNCVSRELAVALCGAVGKRLLTEAEFAYASVNGGQGTRFSWGEDENICAHAVVARDATFNELTERTSMAVECRSQDGLTLPFGPAGRDVPSRDESLAFAGLRHLGGNLAEWVEDRFAELDGPCWKGRPVLVDPVCRTGLSNAMRGGAWSFPAYTASARFRANGAASAPSYVGVRCAKDAFPR